VNSKVQSKEHTEKLGLALSGGGARAVAHLGLLKAMEEMDMKPDVISGSSAGAIIGAFYSSGFKIEEILRIFEDASLFNITNLLFRKQGIFDMNSFEELFKKYFPDNSFHTLKIPLHITAVDILNGKEVCFSEGDLSKSLMASSCIPFVFQPVTYQGTLFVDGGVMNNLPIEILQKSCDYIIGSYCNSIKIEPEQVHMNDIIDRTFHLAMGSSVKLRAEKCDWYFEPTDMSQYSIFNLKKCDEIYAYAYQQAISRKNELLLLKDKIK
jgi:NTE family protein